MIYPFKKDSRVRLNWHGAHVREAFVLGFRGRVVKSTQNWTSVLWDGYKQPWNEPTVFLELDIARFKHI